MIKIGSKIFINPNQVSEVLIAKVSDSGTAGDYSGSWSEEKVKVTIIMASGQKYPMEWDWQYWWDGKNARCSKKEQEYTLEKINNFLKPFDITVTEEDVRY